MRILDILDAPWAISESKLMEIRDLYFAHTRREKLDLKAWEAATGLPAGAAPEPYKIVDGVAVIDIMGILTKSPSAWNRLCGMSSTQEIGRNLAQAVADNQVAAILLRVDSPGGMVDGTQELADAVYAVRGQKPIVALADGCMCSAALWIGAAADQVYITSDTTLVGSIGVVSAHTDISKAEEMSGRKTTEVYTGKHKRITSQYKPLSEEGFAVMKAQTDFITGVFVDAISKYRGASVDDVLARMADGRVFLGKQAIEAGLVDGVSTMAALIADLSQGRLPGRTEAGAASIPTNPTMEIIMSKTREQLAAEAPELLQAILAEGKAEGALAEAARVKGCLAASTPGYEAMALAFALDGKTDPGAAALAVIDAQNADLAKAHQKATTGGPDALPSGGDPERDEAAKAKADVDAKQKAEAKPETAQTIAANIKAHVAAAAAQGRTLTASQAAAELAQKGKE